LALDENNVDRSYLFGRMLAVAEHLEWSTYNEQDRKNRMTNARKYMNVFAERPASSWRQIEKKLLPYVQKLAQYGGKEKKLIDEIISKFSSDEDFISNKPLDNRFLLGYHCQCYKIEQDIKEAAQKRTEMKNDDN